MIAFRVFAAALFLSVPPLLAAQHAHTHDHDHATSAPAAADSPAGGTEVRSLDVYVADDALHVLTAVWDPATRAATLWHQSSHEDGASWSAPVRVDHGGPPPLARGRGTDFPLAVHRSHLAAIWLTPGTGHGGRGPLASAWSPDAGARWMTGASPADDGTDGDHGFIDLTVTPDGAFHAVWLDARLGDGKCLVTATSRDGGRSWSPNRIIDRATCECCWNILQADAAGTLYCLYRDINPRDMALAVSHDAGETWTTYPGVGAFGWDFQGCPHVGGALAVQDTGARTRLHALVWTGRENARGLYYLRAEAPEFAAWEMQRLGGDNARFSDLAISSRGDLVACWTELNAEGPTLFAAHSLDGGTTWSTPRTLAEGEQRPTHPRVVFVGETAHVFWTADADDGTTWRHRALRPAED